MIEDSEIKDGMVVWIKSSVLGRPQKCIVMGGDSDTGYRLVRLTGHCYRVRTHLDSSLLIRTK